jgi:hypothetical protein
MNKGNQGNVIITQSNGSALIKAFAHIYIYIYIYSLMRLSIGTRQYLIS